MALACSLSMHSQTQKVTVCAVLKARFHSGQAQKISSSVSMDTSRIQSALSLCEPGKSVILAKDGAKEAFVSAPLILPRGVVLFIAKGVTLYASRNPRDYDLWPDGCGVTGSKQQGCKPFLFAYRAAYSGVEGDGAIDGQGGAAPSDHAKSWWQLRAEAGDSNMSVPDLVSSYESQSFSVRGVHLRNAAGAHIAMYKTIGFNADNVAIETPASAVGSSGVLLSNSPDAALSNFTIHVPGPALDLRQHLWRHVACEN